MPEPKVVELLVHGVGGATPNEQLDDPSPTRVSGDGTVGFYRHKSPPPGVTPPDALLGTGAEGPNPEASGDFPGARSAEVRASLVQEAYCWGGINSATKSRAAWIILAPFTLINAACWMRSAGPSDRAGRIGKGLHEAASRLLALSLTGTLLLAAGGVGVDMIGWQCASRPECGSRWSVLEFLSRPDSWAHPAGRRLALTALVPLILLGLLWYLARRSWVAYESVRFRVDVAEGTSGLSAPGFWEGEFQVGRLRTLHVSLGVVTVALLLTVPAFTVDGLGDASPGWGAVVLAAVLLVLVLLVVATAAQGSARGFPGVGALRLASFAVLVASVVYVLAPHSWPGPGHRLPGYGTLLMLWVGAQLVLIGILGIAAVLTGRGSSGQMLRGFVAPVFAAFGIFSGIAYSAALLTRVSDWLGHGRDGALLARPPAVVSWAAVAFGVEVVLVVLLALYLVVRVTWRVGRGWRGVLDEYHVTATAPDTPGSGPVPEISGRARQQAKKIVRMRAIADLTESAGRYLALLVLPLVALGTYGVVTTLTHWATPPTPATYSVQYVNPVPGAVTLLYNAGSWVVGATAIGLVWLVSQAYRNEALRKVVGVLWDLGTFWPRAAHPLAPPCYGERCVPELVARITLLTEQGHGVVVSGHSQGSVLAAATLLKLPAARAGRVALLTHGSPLQRLYGRFFPAYFHAQELETLAGRLPRWRNLWRETDPIGGPIEAVERHGALADPVQFFPEPHEVAYPPIRWHLDYPLDPAYGDELAAAAATVRQGNVE
ncbi:hypothetical protein [Cryptosporangium phraense]|uniref:Lipase family protein n=1 Tax=Cryptosporangium phraense TaxID=2593070 RepID=A0A545AMQ9_9ACTN|nr:hypothetical protein [Cryptosporangium phraense]TQS42619.1 hypothetical protein FL583_23295 [Cryptosporangium phraense]